MDLAHRLRIGFAGAIAFVAAVSVALADGVAAGPPAPPLEPDLTTLRPLDFEPLDIGHNSSGHTVLRLSNRIGNEGKGPLELHPTPASDQCIGGEYPNDDHDRDANQRIFGDSNLNGRWDESDQVASDTKVGCFEYHPLHDHWHFQDFSVYTLLDPKTGAVAAGPSRKIGFCILDGDNFGPELPGSPDRGHYPGGDGGCGSFDGQTGEPTEPGTMGLSIGWADTYTAGLPGQKIDITGVPQGVYCLSSKANPEGGSAQIIESNADNNSRRRLVAINPAKHSAHYTGKRCAALRR